MSRPAGPLARCLLAAVTLALVCTLARCEDEERSGWTPFRSTGGTCHDVAFQLGNSVPKELEGNEQAAAEDGAKFCAYWPGDGWQYVGTEFPTGKTSNGTTFTLWRHICRRCGLPRDPVLMWFGRAPLCSGSCPPGWQQVTAPLRHGRAWRSEWSKWSNGVVDVLSVVDSENQPYYYTAFGLDCNGVGGKVLCALGGRPESAGCRYTWRGTAPDCRDACEAGETLIAKDWYGDGKRCGSGTYNKMLCERCQQEILNLNDCTTPTWFGTAPFCAGECNVGDRVMARAQSSSNVPSDQDPGGFGKTCASISGWKVRCQLCSVRGLLGSGPSKGRPTCTAPKAGHVWPGSPVALFPAVKTYAACCQECRDAAECRRFHVGPTGCFLFAEASGAAKRVVAGGGRAGGGAWQAGSKVV